MRTSIADFLSSHAARSILFDAAKSSTVKKSWSVLANVVYVDESSSDEFYRDHFIFLNSADTDLELISRTVGIDRVIDEFIFKFTHEKEVDWL